MTNESIPVSVRVLEKEYKIACPPGEHEELLASASEVNDKMREIQRGGKIIGAERIAVMAAINIAHDFLKAKNTNVNDSDLSARLDDIQKSVDEALKTVG